jgi:nitrile hydratase subunit beta
LIDRTFTSSTAEITTSFSRPAPASGVPRAEPPFHAEWEGRVLALQRAIRFTRAWNIDMSRDAKERLPAGVYLGASYCERWALGMERNALGQGLIDPDELTTGHALRPGRPLRRMTKDGSPQRVRSRLVLSPDAQQIAVQDRRPDAREEHQPGEPHAPAALRARQAGVVEAIRSCHVFPDSAATGAGENPQWLYTVVFDGRELWGAQADPTLKVGVRAVSGPGLT